MTHDTSARSSQLTAHWPPLVMRPHPIIGRPAHKILRSAQKAKSHKTRLPHYYPLLQKRMSKVPASKEQSLEPIQPGTRPLSTTPAPETFGGNGICVAEATNLYTFVKTHQMVQLKSVNFALCKPFFSKPHWKKRCTPSKTFI